MSAPTPLWPVGPAIVIGPPDTEPAPVEQDDDSAVVEAAIGILAVYLASRAAIAAVTLPSDIVASLVALGLRKPAVLAAGRLGMNVPMTGRTRAGAPRLGDRPTALRRVAAGEPTFRARYIAGASRRLDQGIAEGRFADALQREQRYLAQHRQAGIRRRAAAARYDAAAARSRTGFMVWETKRDRRVTPDCQRLQGRVFHRDEPPDGHIPGTQHVLCRCWARPY